MTLSPTSFATTKTGLAADRQPARPVSEVLGAECSRVANIGLQKPRFSESGETLRRWCEVQAYYSQFSYADKLLDVYSFDHLVEAKRLAYQEKVKSAIEALKLAYSNRWTADEM